MPMIVMSIVGMQYYSNATLWPRMSQLVYATDEISKGLYSEVVPLGTIRTYHQLESFGTTLTQVQSSRRYNRLL